MSDRAKKLRGAFDPAVLAADPQRRPFIVSMLEAALEALDPFRAVLTGLQRRGTTLMLGGEEVELSAVRRIIVLGLGKASAGMALAIEDLLADRALEGVIVAPHEPALERLTPVVGSHPVPDQRSLDAGRQLLDLAQSAGPDDLVITLISGGGSALAEVGAGDLTMPDLSTTAAMLVESGAPIDEINAVRKHLSLIKGGRLAEAVGRARMLTLIVSDVVGDHPDVVASGPTVPDPSTFDDALDVLRRRDLVDAVPKGVIRHLQRGSAGEEPETPKGEVPPHQTLAIVLSGVRAAEAACRVAAESGVAARVVTYSMTGEASRVGRKLVTGGKRVEGPGVYAYAGETTVTVTGPGIGGRNQELALAAALALDGIPDVVVAALATDGVDGPTDAAGAIVDGSTAERVRKNGRDPLEDLRNNDSHRSLAASEDLLRCGPTGTNAGDLALVYRS